MAYLPCHNPNCSVGPIIAASPFPLPEIARMSVIASILPLAIVDAAAHIVQLAFALPTSLAIALATVITVPLAIALAITLSVTL